MIKNMLCVDQKKRWTAEQLLQHPWIKMGDDTLNAKDLTSSITVLKKFNAKRRLRAAADAVIMANRMNRLLGKNSFSAAEEMMKKRSMLDPEALQAVAENSEGEKMRDSDIFGDSPSINPALDLLNDKELENI